jgi:hypothetical protein
VVSDELLKRASGSFPVSLLLMSLSTWRELFTKDSGIPPERKFLPRSTCTRDELHKDGGIDPDRLLPARIRVRSFWSIPTAAGMLPCSLLLLRFIIWMFLHWLKVGRISPSRELFDRSRTRSCVQDEIADGIPPFREFMLRLR